MSAGILASELWGLINKPGASDNFSREQALAALGCTEEQLDEAIAILRQFIVGVKRQILADRAAAPQWVPFAERKPSKKELKEIRNLLFFG